MKNIIDEINKRYENLTKSQKIIADFLLENYALVPFETLNEIAHRIGLSTTSLIRFSRTMGYKDYTDLKKNIQDLIKVKVSLPSRLSLIHISAVTAYFPVKKDAVEGPEAWTKSADTYVSNGAFRLKEINPQASYVLEKNPEYIDADVYKRQIIIRV